MDLSDWIVEPSDSGSLDIVLCNTDTGESVVVDWPVDLEMLMRLVEKYDKG